MKPPRNPLRTAYRWSRRLGLVDAMWLMYRPSGGGPLGRADTEQTIRIVPIDELDQLRREGLVDRQVGDAKADSIGDRTLVGAFDDSRLVSFVWLAHQSIAASDNFCRSVHLGASVGLPDGCVYLFNAWTDPGYRGQRLVSDIVHWTLDHYLPAGSSLSTAIDWTNERSLRAFERVGMRKLGLIVRAGWGPAQVSLIPTSLKQKGFRVAEDAPGFKWATPGVSKLAHQQTA